MWGEGEKSTSKENHVFFSDNNLESFDDLLFFDSRGLTINEDSWEESYAWQLKKTLEGKERSYCFVSRPKNLTVFASLYNFLIMNQHITFKRVITNLGFVDTTPKKKDNIRDISLQLGNEGADSLLREHELYGLNDGSYEMLHSLEYSQKYLKSLCSYLENRFDCLTFITTPEVSRDISIERKRPSSFFSQLRTANNLIRQMAELIGGKCSCVDISGVQESYDGVHYTKKGHNQIYKKLMECI